MARKKDKEDELKKLMRELEGSGNAARSNRNVQDDILAGNLAASERARTKNVAVPNKKPEFKEYKPKSGVSKALDQVTGVISDIGSDIGHVGSTFAEGIGKLGKVAFTDYTMEDMREDAEEQAEENRNVFTPYSGDASSDLSKELLRATQRTGDAGTFGLLSDSVERQGFNTDSFSNKNRGTLGKIGDVGYDILGSLAPGAGIAKGLRGTRLGANIGANATRAQRIGQTAKEGMAAGAIYSGAEGAITEGLNPEERDLQDHITNLALDVGGGALLDPLVSEVGASVLRRFRSGEIPNAQRAKEIIDEEVRQLPPNVASRGDVQGRIDEALSTLNNRPSTSQYNQSNIQTQTQMGFQQGQRDNSDRITELMDQLTNADNALQSRRTDYVNEQFAPFEEQIRATAEGEQNWMQAKQAREELSRINNILGRNNVAIPEETREWADRLPANLRAARGKQGAEDIYTTAGELGFTSDAEGVEQMLDYIDNLRQTANVRRSDLLPNEAITSGKMNQMQRQFENEYNQSGEGKSTQNIVNTLSKEFRNTPQYEDVLVPQANVNTMSKANRTLDDLLGPAPQTPQTQRTVRYKNVPQQQQQTGPSKNNQQQQKQQQGITNVYGDKNKNTTTIDTGIRKAMSDINTNFFDDIGKLRNMENRVSGKKNDYGEAYVEGRNTRKALANAQYYTERNLVEAQERFLASNKEKGALANAYEYAEARNLLEVKQANPDYKLPNNMTEQELFDEYIAPYADDPSFNEFADSLVQNFGRHNLDMLQESGLISEETKNTLIEQYPNYMPKFKDKTLNDPDAFQQMIEKRMQSQRKPIYELEQGSDDLVANPVDNLAKYTANTYAAASKNKAYQAMVDSLSEQEINGITLMREVDNETYNNLDRGLKVMFDGEPRYYELSPDVAEVVNNLNTAISPQQVADFSKKMSDVFARTSRVMRESITANPMFGLRQLSRDIPESYINGNYSLFRDLAPAFMDTVTGGKFNRQMYEQFYESGAGTANIFASDREFSKAKSAIRRQKPDKNIKDLTVGEFKNATSSILDRFMRFNQGTENIAKMAQFRASMRRTGGNVERSAFESADLMDYNMAGKWIRPLNRHIGFLNVNLRGKERMVRAIREKPLSTLSKMAVVGTVPSMMAYWAYNSYASQTQKDRIDGAYPSERQTYWLIPDPTNEDKVLRVGKPYETALSVTTPFEWYLNNQQDRPPLDMKEEREEWFSQMSIDPSMNIITPATDFLYGQDSFTGRDIVPQREQDLPSIEQQDVHTAQSAVGIANIFNAIPSMQDSKLASPRMIEHLTEGYTPVSGEAVNNVIDRLAEVTGIRENEAPARTGPDAFIDDLNPWMANNNQTSSRVGTLYDTQSQLQSERRENGEDYASNLYRIVNKAVDQDGEFAAAIRDIESDNTLDRQEKQEQIDRIQEERNDFSRKMTELEQMIQEEGAEAVNERIDLINVYNSSDPATSLYREMNDNQTILKNMKKELTEQGQTFPYTRVYRVLNKSERDINELENDIEDIQADPNLSSSEKESLISEARTRIDNLQNNLNAFNRSIEQQGPQAVEDSLVGTVDESSQNTSQILINQFKQAGVPGTKVRKILDSDLDKDEKAAALRDLLNQYQ